MLNFQLLPGDKYDGRCAEIYITEKQFLIYHCSVCDEIYATFNELLSHITKDHYENTKEYNNNNGCKDEVVKVARKKQENVKTIGKEENQLKALEFEANLVIKNNKTQQQLTISCLNEIEILENNEEIKEGRENLPAIFDVSKTSPQRKKPRLVMGILKNYSSNRTKLNSLTRFPSTNAQEERKFVCGICGFAFKEKYNLRSHLLRHSNQKNFSCSQCPKRFFTKVELRLHEYRHKGERSHLCNHCGMGFVSSSSLTQHIKKQHSLNHYAFNCEQCDKSYSNFKQLKTHQHKEDKCKNFTENKQEFCYKDCDLDLNKKMTKKHNFKLEIEEETQVQNDKAAEWLIEEGLFVEEQNFDEYELVQTLTDLECNKTV